MRAEDAPAEVGRAGRAGELGDGVCAGVHEHDRGRGGGRVWAVRARGR